MVTYTHWTFIR